MLISSFAFCILCLTGMPYSFLDSVFQFDRNHNQALSSFITCYRVCSKNKTTGATSGIRTVYPPVLWWGSCCSIFIFLYSVYHILPFFFWSLCCVSFDLRLLITPLVSSNVSYLVGFDRSSSMLFTYTHYLLEINVLILLGNVWVRN
jgi:hypothetical protein